MAIDGEGIPDPPDDFHLTSEPGTYPPAFEMNLGVTLITGDTLIFEASPNEDFFPPVVANAIVLTGTERKLSHGLQGRLSSGRWYFRTRIEAERGNSVPSNVVSDVMPPIASLSSQLFAEVGALRSQLANLPTFPGNLGHNNPPEDIGLPPYSEKDRDALNQVVDVLLQAIKKGEHEPATFAGAAAPVKSVSEKLGAWLLKKADLAVDEAIKKGAGVGGLVLLVQFETFKHQLDKVLGLLSKLLRLLTS